MSERARDEAGRPRNPRPRDRLGRPLSAGEQGVDPIPDELDLTPQEALDFAQRLLDGGRAFGAHEVLEAIWKQAPDDERDLWRALAQVAVGITHLERGNATGAVALLQRGARGLESYRATPPHRIAAAQVADTAIRLAEQVDEARKRGADRPRAPKLQLQR